MTVEKINKKEYEAKRVNDPKGKELEPWRNKSLKTSVNLMSMLEAFGKKLYDSKISALRETVVNHISHGAWAAIKKGETAHVEIWFDSQKRTIVIRDFNGMGIPFDDMQKNCTELGGSGNDDRSLPGQHGYGFFAWLAIANFCTVETWSRVTDEHYCYVGREGKIWEPSDERTLDSYGTKTTMVVDEDVNYEDLESNCHQFIEHFPVKTKIHTSTGEELDYGNRAYGDLFEKPLTIENDDILLVIEQTSESPDTWRNRNYGGAEDQEFYINNVPITVNSDVQNAVYQCFKFKCNIKNEAFVVPPIQRDKLNKADCSKVVDLIDKMVCSELVKHECDNIEDFLSIDDKWLWRKDRTIRQAFKDKTKNFYKTMDYKVAVNDCDPEARCNQPKAKKAAEYLEFGNVVQRYDNVFIEYQNGRKDRLVIGHNLPKSCCLSSFGSNYDGDGGGFWPFAHKKYLDVKEAIKTNKYKIHKEDRNSIMVYCGPMSRSKTSMNISDIKKEDVLLNIPTGDKTRESWFNALHGPVELSSYGIPYDVRDRKLHVIGESEFEVSMEHRFPLNISFSRKYAERLHSDGNVLTISGILEKLQTITTFVTTMEPKNEWEAPQAIEMTLFDAMPFMKMQNYKMKEMKSESSDKSFMWNDKHHSNPDFTSLKYLESIDNPVAFNGFHVPNVEDRLWINVAIALWQQYTAWCLADEADRHKQKPSDEKINFASIDGRDLSLRTWVSTLDYSELGSDFKEWIDWDEVHELMGKTSKGYATALSYLSRSYIDIYFDNEDNGQYGDQTLAINALNALKWGTKYVRKFDSETSDAGKIKDLYTSSDHELKAVRVYDIMRTGLNGVHPRLKNMFIHLFTDETDYEDQVDGNQWNGKETQLKKGSKYHLTGKEQIKKGWWSADKDTSSTYRDEINKMNRLVCSMSEFIYATTIKKLDWSDHRLLRVFGLGCLGDELNTQGFNGIVSDRLSTQQNGWLARFSYMEIEPTEVWADIDLCFPVTVGNLQKRYDVIKLEGTTNPLYTDMWQTCQMFEKAKQKVLGDTRQNNVEKPINTGLLVNDYSNPKINFIIKKLRETNPEFFSEDGLTCDIDDIAWRDDVELFHLEYFQDRKNYLLERLATVDMLIEYRNSEKFNTIKGLMTGNEFDEIQYTVKETIDSMSVTASSGFNWAMFILKKGTYIENTDPEYVRINKNTFTVKFKMPEIEELPPILNYK